LLEYEIDYCPSREEWRSFLEEHDRGNLQQSFEFGEIYETLGSNIKIVRVLLKEHERPVGLVQGYYDRGSIMGGTLYVEGHHGTGPVVTDGQDKEQVFRRLVLALENYAVKHRVPEGLSFTSLKWRMCCKA